MKFARRIFLLWLGAVFLLASTQALAANCTVLLSEGTVDFGMMRTGVGKDANMIRPSPAQRTYVATCNSAAQMNLVFHATRADTGDGEALKFGDAGTYRVRILDARLDGNPVQIARLPTIGQPPADAPAGDLILKPTDIVAPVNGQQLLSGMQLAITFQVSANVPASAIRIAQPNTLNAVSQIRLEARDPAP